MSDNNAHPHGREPVQRAGQTVGEARGAVILVHGRGASARDILSLRDELASPELTYLAPQAAGHTWYPASFMAPRAANEPGRSSGLAVLDGLAQDLEKQGLLARRVMILGFSQGACLSLELAARHPRRYGAVVAFTGGLIGPPGTLGGYSGSLAGTPIFLGAGDPDPHVPWSRVEESAALLTDLGAEVTVRRYPGLPHTINEDELSQARSMLRRMLRDDGDDAG